MLNKLLHWLWKLNRLDIECEYFCPTCPRYEACSAESVPSHITADYSTGMRATGTNAA